MFVAKRENGEEIHLLHGWKEKQLIILRKNERFFCPICHLEVQLKLGKQKKWHFAHKKSHSCKIEFENESAYHLRGKEQLYRWLQSQVCSIKMEHYLPAIQQRPDLFVVIDNRQIAIEYQCATLSVEQLLKRTEGYWKEGIQILWILGGNQLKRHATYWLSLSSFHSCCVQYYSNPYILYFCPDVKAFFKCNLLLPFSSSTVFSHVIYFPLHTTTLTSLLTTSSISTQRLEKEWLNKKQRLRANGIYMWNRSERPFLELLYHHHISPSCFPAEIGVPLPSLLAFRTHSFIWQAYILIELLSKFTVGEYFSLHTIFQYVERNRAIHRRLLPYFPPTFWQQAVREYMQFLCQIGEIEQVDVYKYRKVRCFFVPKTEEEVQKFDRLFLAEALKLVEAKYNMSEEKTDIIKKYPEGIT
ncbi:competence protein CoiA family protein [Bacillus sp. S13(2024)]|uniref:competence protein CoiA n=1 Tax=unclassified Bacillus (in: firmicutes) TaxID=185979 RepID=UPI003D1DEAE1